MPKKLIVRLRDVLSADLLAGAEVLAGKEGLDNVITSVNVMEVPDIIDWVRPGEFLLTTAYSLSSNPEALNSLIPQLEEKGVCGMGIKTKRYIDEVPASVMATANELSFPIIRLPENVQFGDLIKMIFAYIVGAQTRMLELINTFNDKIKEVMLRQGGNEKFAELIHSMVNAPVVITDDIFRSYSAFFGSDEWRAKLEGNLEGILNTPEKKSQYVLNEISTEIDQIGGQSVKRYSIPIYFDTVLYGKIMIWDVNKSIHADDIFVIDSASSLIALHTVTRITLVERENVHRNTFIELLLSNNAEAHAKALESAEYYVFHPEMLHQCVILRLIPQHISGGTDTSKGNNLLLLSVIQQVKREYRYGFVSASRDNEVVFILEFNAGMNPNQKTRRTQEFCQTLYRVAQKEKVGEQAFIGAGNDYADYDRLCDSNREAVQVINVLRGRFKPDQHIGYFEDLGLLRLFGQPEMQESLRGYSDEILAPLLKYDDDRGGELIETLKAYFANCGNLKKVSEDLFAHYNTIIYRINRIRSVYKIDVKDPDTAFNLQLAIRIRDLQGERE